MNTHSFNQTSNQVPDVEEGDVLMYADITDNLKRSKRNRSKSPLKWLELNTVYFYV